MITESKALSKNLDLFIIQYLKKQKNTISEGKA